MHPHPSGEPLSDADLDRDLTAALCVEPSAEFLARVRMRIAREPEPSQSAPWAMWVPWARWTMSALWPASARPFPVSAPRACAVAVVGVAAIVGSFALIQIDAPALPRLVASLAAGIPPLTPAPLAIAVGAARRDKARTERPTPEMRAVMNANAEASAALRAQANGSDYAALASAAATYQKNFAYLEGFWADRSADGAVQISRAGRAAASALEAAARSKDHAALEAAIAAILGTCGACHKHYREELPDRTYEIRL